MDKNVTKNSRQGKKKMSEKAKLEAAFDSATSVGQMGNAAKNMVASQLFNVKEFDFAFWKLAQQASAEIQNLTFGASSSQKNKIKRKKAFHHAQSADEMLKALQKMESCFEEKELGLECWRLTQKLFFERGDPEKILCYGKKALKWSIDNNADSNHDYVSSLEMITDTLPMMGYACWKLKRFDESLSYLNWSKRNLSKLELDNSLPAKLVFTSLGATHFHLAIVKTALGRGEEVIVHMSKILEIQEKLKAESSFDQASSISVDRAIDMMVKELEGLGITEQDEVVGAVRLLKESTGGGDSSEENSKGGV